MSISGWSRKRYLGLGDMLIYILAWRHEIGYKGSSERTEGTQAMTQQTVLEAVGAMMKVHCEIMGVPLNSDKETLVWHIIASLIEYCDAQDQMAQDAGYENFAGACEVAPVKDGELKVKLV